jgi:hypothetical protein
MQTQKQMKIPTTTSTAVVVKCRSAGRRYKRRRSAADGDEVEEPASGGTMDSFSDAAGIFFNFFFFVSFVLVWDNFIDYCAPTVTVLNTR